jgi:PAS domain S-box-containing protein
MSAFVGSAESVELPRIGRPSHYGLALLIVALTIGLKLAFFDAISVADPFFLLFAAVGVAAWTGGMGPSFVVTAIAAVAADWLWIRRPAGAELPPDRGLQLILFTLKSVLLAFICNYFRGTKTAAGDRYRRLFEAFRDCAVFQLDAAGRIVGMHPGAGDILRAAQVDVVGRPFGHFVMSEDQKLGEPAAQLKEAESSGRSIRTGWRKRADGTKVWAETLVTGGGGESGFAVVVRDISERRKAEEAGRKNEEQARQAQRLEAVGRLAGGVAHDFNNLLTIILGNVDLILEHDAPATMHRTLLDDVRAAGRRAAGLTRQLLAFSRREPAVPRRIDLNLLVTDMESMLRRTIAEHIVFTTELRPGVGPVVADPAQIEQVVLNLVVNARDAMPKGGKLLLRTAEENFSVGALPVGAEGPAGRYVVLSVTDTGHGMDAATQTRIFEPFFTTKEVGKGTGLGLATVYGIVKQAKGWVVVDSRPGAGTTFRVYLPRAEGTAEPAPLVGYAEQPPLTATRTVLLVEDDAALRDMSKRALESVGYTVLACPDGRAALEASRRFTGAIDLLITDLVMPLMTGRQLAVALMQERRKVRVLLISGYSESILANLSGPLPCEEILDKPFVPNDLTRKVREILDRSSVNQPLPQIR